MGWYGVSGMVAASSGEDCGMLAAVKPGMAPVLVAHIGV